MPFEIPNLPNSGGLMTGNGFGTVPGPTPDSGEFTATGPGIVPPTMALPQMPNIPSIPGNPTGTNNVPGGITGEQNLTTTGPGIVPPTMALSIPTNNIGLAPGAIATTDAQGGTGGNALATSTAGSQSTQTNYNPASAFSVNGQNPTDIGNIVAKILNIPNTTGPNTPQINSVAGQPASVPAPTPINANFPANGIDNTGNPAGNIDLGALLGIKQNTALPGQLDDIYGKGFGSTYASLLQNGGGFNPDINNALINAMRPQENRAFDNIRQTMANAGLSPSGSPFALAAGDFWSQAANNENATIANNFNQAIDRTHNLFGQGLEAAQLAQANKMGPLQWLSALSPLLGPLISGLASKIPSINVNTSSQGGQSTASGTGGQGGTSRSTSRGGGASTTNTNTNTPTATGGTATASPTISPTISNRNRSQVNPTVSSNSNPYIDYKPYLSSRVDPTLTNTNIPTFENKPYIAPEINPTISTNPVISPVISPSINPSILGTVSPTFQNTPTFQNNPSVHVDPTISNTSSNDAHINPVISPAISPTMINSMGGIPNLPGGGVSPIPPPPSVGSLPPSGLPPGFPPPVSPGAPPSTGTRIGFPGGPMGPTGVGQAPPPPTGGYGNMPTLPGPILDPNFGPGTSWGYPTSPYDPGSPTVDNFPYPAGGYPGYGGLPGLAGTPSTNPALDPNGWGGPYIPNGPGYQPAPIQSGMNPGGSSVQSTDQFGGLNQPDPWGNNYNLDPYGGGTDPFGYNDPYGYGGWNGWGGGGSDSLNSDGRSIFDMMGI